MWRHTRDRDELRVFTFHTEIFRQQISTPNFGDCLKTLEIGVLCAQIHVGVSSFTLRGEIGSVRDLLRGPYFGSSDISQPPVYPSVVAVGEPVKTGKKG